MRAGIALSTSQFNSIEQIPKTCKPQIRVKKRIYKAAFTMHVYRPRILYRLTSRRRISKGTKRTYTSSSQLPQALNPTIPIEEETLPSYEPTSYYPVTPGHVFQNRYKTLTKVGWGTCSTVWLARDLNR